MDKTELARVAGVLRDLRGTPAYPPTAAALLDKAESKADPSELSKRGAKKYLRSTAMEPAKNRPRAADYYPGALVFLEEDADKALASDAAILLVLRLSRSEATRVHDIASLKQVLPSSQERSRALDARFEAALGRRLQLSGGSPSLPPGVGVLPAKGHPLLFFISDVHPVVWPENGEKDSAGKFNGVGRIEVPPFPEAFGRAFDELNQQTGRRNYVLLHDLRKRLAAIPRPDFDAGLNELRRSQKYSLDSADGRHIRLTPEQIDAGIREAGSVLVYVARR